MSETTIDEAGRETARDAIFSLREALARLDDDVELFQTLAELFVEQGPKDLADTRAALSAQDAAALARAAHRIKGAVLQFCAPTVLDAARRLEELGRAGDLKEAAAACARLEEALLCLLDALRHHIRRDSRP